MTTIIAPRVHDLGGFQVRRAVPSIQARSIGPFVFVDQMGGPRHLWWNFVSSSARERTEQARRDWSNGEFDPVAGDAEFIPLPGQAPSPPVYTGPN